jgi:hypothetical protein
VSNYISSFVIDASKFIAPMTTMIAQTETTTVKVGTLKTAVSSIDATSLRQLEAVAIRANVPLDDLAKAYDTLISKGVEMAPKDMGAFADKIRAAKTVTADLAKTTVTVNESMTPSVVTAEMLTQKMGAITSNALTAYAAFRALKEPLLGLDENWDKIKTSALDAFVTIRDGGDFTVVKDNLMTIFNTGVDTFNELRVRWNFVQEGFTASKAVISDVWSLIKTQGAASIGTIRAVGTTFLTSTLPNMLTFVGRGVLSMGSFVASLFGATSAQVALNVAMTANPIGVIILGIAAIGAAVVGLIYYWDEVKSFLVDMGKLLWKMNPFSWLLDLTERIFPNFYNGVKDWFGKTFTWIDTTLIQPVKDFFNWFADAPSKIADINKATQDSLKSTFNINTEGSSPFGKTYDGLMNPKNNAVAILDENGAKTASKSRKLDLGVDKKEAKITGDRSNVKNINQTIGKLVEKVEINITNSNGRIDLRELREQITRILLSSTNDFNYQ